ncbi:transmembrane protein, putative (macronuclear) [Tetrahymena thermophila SB210]|uniref:Transmembrane protein, putative n=1 Tax=Tetrahymena thermophila (strain SB210) TaxID=312017 RepID=W7X715_TETTS|nr:transmembrane protein, putative [Tetrahymena thermophila SB210]EWS73162.1 transmembrane protein, putative [Tetrahymena thermophila SB210]|eukprot:XP_012654349.1 transmembrane protein, putative [Tetrahymena thermophila SB210]
MKILKKQIYQQINQSKEIKLTNQKKSQSNFIIQQICKFINYLKTKFLYLFIFILSLNLLTLQQNLSTKFHENVYISYLHSNYVNQIYLLSQTSIFSRINQCS